MTSLEAWCRLWTGSAADPVAGLGGAAAAFHRFAVDCARLASAGGADSAAWETLARRLTADVLPGWPAGLPPAAAAGGAAVVAELSAATAAGFAQRMQAATQPMTLRATFDAWVDAAEEAFRRVAFTADFSVAQAALCNELVRMRAVQQRHVDEAAGLAGLPSRAEVDALHDTVRELRRELDARSATRPARRARRVRPA